MKRQTATVVATFLAVAALGCGGEEQAEGEQAAQQARQEFHEERARIVQEAGLDTARYTEIRQVVQSDPALQQRYLEFQQEVQR